MTLLLLSLQVKYYILIILIKFEFLLILHICGFIEAFELCRLKENGIMIVEAGEYQKYNIQLQFPRIFYYYLILLLLLIFVLLISYTFHFFFYITNILNSVGSTLVWVERMFLLFHQNHGLEKNYHQKNLWKKTKNNKEVNHLICFTLFLIP